MKKSSDPSLLSKVLRYFTSYRFNFGNRTECIWQIRFNKLVELKSKDNILHNVSQKALGGFFF